LIDADIDGEGGGDHEAAATLELSDSTGAVDDIQIDLATEPSSVMIEEELRRLVQGLERPISLASIAARLRATFGRSISKGWAGAGSFKALLLQAAPGIIIEEIGPSYVVPTGIEPSERWPRHLRKSIEARERGVISDAMLEPEVREPVNEGGVDDSYSNSS
jgi:hypothetical protein